MEMVALSVEVLREARGSLQNPQLLDARGLPSEGQQLIYLEPFWLQRSASERLSSHHCISNYQKTKQIIPPQAYGGTILRANNANMTALLEREGLWMPYVVTLRLLGARNPSSPHHTRVSLRVLSARLYIVSWDSSQRGLSVQGEV